MSHESDVPDVRPAIAGAAGGSRPGPATTTGRILTAAAALIAHHGEAGLRVADVVKLSGVSVGSIYQHFGDRDGLVAAVNVEQFRGQIAEDTRSLSTLIGAVQTREEFVDAVSAVAAASAGLDRRDGRWQRVSVLGAARRRPALAEILADLQGQLTESLAAVVRAGQERGLVDAGIDPRALAAFVQAYSVGKILTELGPDTEVGHDEWVDIVRRFATSLLPQPGD